MPNYSEKASRARPVCVVFLVDQSHSMTEGIGGSPKAKMDAVGTAVNKIIAELITICEKGEDTPRHYFDVGLVGYTTDDNGTPVVGSAFGGELKGRDLVGIPEQFGNPLAVEVRKKMVESVDDAGNLVMVEEETNFPVWYAAPPREQLFGTPMRTAFEHARAIVEAWVAEHPASFPPMVINLTDGEPTDGDPEAVAEEFKQLATADGAVLVVNCHMSAQKGDGVLFPTDESQLPDDFAKMLFRMSSAMPDKMRASAELKQMAAPAGCRMMAFNANMVSLMKLISVGTDAGNAAPAAAPSLRPDARPDHLR